MREQRFPRVSYARRADQLAADLDNWRALDREVTEAHDGGPISPWIAQKRRARADELEDLVHILDLVALRIEALV